MQGSVSGLRRPAVVRHPKTSGFFNSGGLSVV